MTKLKIISDGKQLLNKDIAAFSYLDKYIKVYDGGERIITLDKNHKVYKNGTLLYKDGYSVISNQTHKQVTGIVKIHGKIYVGDGKTQIWRYLVKYKNINNNSIPEKVLNFMEKNMIYNEKQLDFVKRQLIDLTIK